jgi:hypothetical protein
LDDNSTTKDNYFLENKVVSEDGGEGFEGNDECPQHDNSPSDTRYGNFR